MNITVSNQLLAQEVRLLNKITAEKMTIPILSHLLLVAEDQLYLTANDYDLCLRTSCAATVSETGSMTLPAEPLLNILELLPGDADITIGTGGFIRSGNFKSRLSSLPIQDFPVTPEIAGDPTPLSASVLRSLVERAEYAISDKEQKHVLKGALLSLSGEIIAMVASDAKRLSIVTANRPAPGLDSHAIVPTKALEAILEQAPAGELTFSASDNHLFFNYGRRLLISKRVAGEFPKYQRIIPKDNKNILHISREELAAALRRVGLICEVITMHFSKDSLDLTSKSMELGSAEERLSVQYEGEPFKVLLTWKYLLDFLEHAAEPTVTIAGKDSKTPLLVTDGSDFINVIVVTS